jgi:hypothetical protein
MPEARLTGVQSVDLAGLDSLGADSLALFAYQGPEPLGGLGDLVDWRLGGRIGQAQSRGHFTGQIDDQLLVPGPHRLGASAVFVFGLGPQEALTREAFRKRVAHALTVVAQAGGRRLAVIPPEGPHPEGCPDPEGLLLALGNTTNGQIIAKVLSLRVD